MIVAFDLVNTLAKHKTGISIIYRNVLSRHMYFFDENLIKNVRENVIKSLSEIENFHCHCSQPTDRSLYNQWINITKEVLKKLDINFKIQNQIAIEIHNAINNYEDLFILADVPNILESLKKHNNIKLILFTNSYEKVKIKLLELGIDKYFDLICTPSDIGHIKPCPNSFMNIREKYGFTNEKMIYVGDSLHEDGIGAIKGGIDKVIIVNSDCDFKHDGIYHVNKLVDLIGIIENI